MTSWALFGLCTHRMYAGLGTGQHPCPLSSAASSSGLHTHSNPSTQSAAASSAPQLHHPQDALLLGTPTSPHLCHTDLLLFPPVPVASGRESPQAERRGEGAAAAQPESRGVERGGRQRRHLQRVPLQGLQPGTSVGGKEFYNAGGSGLQSGESHLQGSAK